MKFLVFALLFLGVVSSYDLVIKDGKCRELPATPFFDLERYMGTWYEQKRYEDTYQLDGDCVTATYTIKEDGTVKVHNQNYNFSNSTHSEAIGKAILSFPEYKPLTGKFSVAFSPRQPLQNNYNVLFTDYEHISLVWNCKDLADGKHKENFWVLSRTPVLERKDDVDFVQKIVDEFFDKTQIRPTIQGDKCQGTGGAYV